MANKVPYYFYAPTWDFPPPPTGPIRLGNVITSLEKPEQPLFTAELPTQSELYSSSKHQVEFSREKLLQGSFGILTQFLSVLGVGGDVTAGWNKSDEETFTFDTITTTQFLPNATYLQEKCIDASPTVQRWLERSRYRKPLYVITGLKTVEGAMTAKSETTRGKEASASVTVDGTVWSGGVAPVSVGPKVEAGRSKSSGMSWSASSDFVLAYRVKRIKVAKTNEVREEEDYKKGALLGNEHSELKKNGFSVIEEEGILDGADSEWDAIQVAEGDDVVSVGMPKTQRA